MPSTRDSMEEHASRPDMLAGRRQRSALPALGAARLVSCGSSSQGRASCRERAARPTNARQKGCMD
eukprot:364163-Chlamydomonas_euryale.AAC.15